MNSGAKLFEFEVPKSPGPLWKGLKDYAAPREKGLNVLSLATIISTSSLRRLSMWVANAKGLNSWD